MIAQDSSGFSDDDDEEWDLEDAYNFDPEKLAELLQKGGKIDEEELVVARSKVCSFFFQAFRLMLGCFNRKLRNFETFFSSIK